MLWEWGIGFCVVFDSLVRGSPFGPHLLFGPWFWSEMTGRLPGVGVRRCFWMSLMWNELCVFEIRMINDINECFTMRN